MSLVGFKADNHPQQVAKRGGLQRVDDRATHPDDFAAWNDRFRFTIDVAASPHNTKVPDRYFTETEDGLAQSWAGERVWCNPPYSDIGAWVRKAWAEWDVHNWGLCPNGSRWNGGVPFRFCTACDREEGETGVVRAGDPGVHREPMIVMLLPANRTEQGWWQDHVEPRRDQAGSPLKVEFLRGRLRFIQAGRTEVGPNERPPFGCCLLIWSAP
jgi:hypothetical protein